MGPGTQRTGIEMIQQGREEAARLAITLAKGCRWLGMGEVEPADAGQQELASQRGHGVVEVDRDTRGEQAFSRHESGRTAANDYRR